MLKYILPLMLLSSAAFAEEPLPHPVDKVTHAVGGAVIAHMCMERTDWHPLACGVALPLFVGVVWEMKDRNFDPVDAAAWPVGGVVITIRF